jgi:peptidoglycan/xylan/chitin deacetylase (PgdA/CDA1 family)
MPLLNALRAGGARATFFIWGQHARQHPNLLRAEQAAGMWIANHTFTHPHLTQLGEPAAFNEINQTQQTIRQLTGLTPTLFRPPFGETNAAVRADQARLGLTEVLWTVDSRDWAGASTAQIVAAAAMLRPGGIRAFRGGHRRAAGHQGGDSGDDGGHDQDPGQWPTEPKTRAMAAKAGLGR